MSKVLQRSVADLMTRDLVFLKPDDSLTEVEEIFKGRHIHHIPVVDKTGTLLGMLSKADFLQARHMLQSMVKPPGFDLATRKPVLVRDIMTVQPISLSPSDSLETAANIFLENMFHALPILDHGKLVGLITTHDLLAYCCRKELYLPAG